MPYRSASSWRPGGIELTARLQGAGEPNACLERVAAFVLVAVGVGLGVAGLVADVIGGLGLIGGAVRAGLAACDAGQATLVEAVRLTRVAAVEAGAGWRVKP